MENLKVQHVITEDTGKGNADFYAVTLADTRKAWGKPPIAALPIEQHKYAVLFAAAPEILAALVRARDHVIMGGVKQTDNAQALEQIRAAIAKATGGEG